MNHKKQLDLERRKELMYPKICMSYNAGQMSSLDSIEHIVCNNSRQALQLQWHNLAWQDTASVQTIRLQPMGQLP